MDIARPSRTMKIPCQQLGFRGGQGRGRTADLWFFRPALCQLSYLTVSGSETAQ
jgi:hypothetical protein